MAKKGKDSKAGQAVQAPTTESIPKTVRKKAIEKSVEQKINRTLDAFPDKIDLRDWEYQPTLRALPDEIVNCQHVPEILDQGTEGACTGFALAAIYGIK